METNSYNNVNTISYKIKYFNFYFCKYGLISNGNLILNNIQNPINIKEINSICLNKNHKPLIKYKSTKIILFISLICCLLSTTDTVKQSFLIVIFFITILSFICKKKKLEFCINLKNDKELHFDVEISDERKAKLLIKKIYKYKEFLINEGEEGK